MSLPTPQTTPQGTVPFSHPCLLGSTGTLGQKILDYLLNHFHATSITLILRESPDTSGQRRHSFPVDIRTHYVSNFSDIEAMTKALQGCDVLISALSHKAIHVEEKIVEAAIAAGVKRFMPSEYTLDVTDTKYRGLASSNALAKQRIEWADRLHHLAVAEGKIEFTTIVPAAFIDYCIESGFWGYDLKKRTVPSRIAKSTSPRTGCSLAFTADAVAMSVRMPPELTRNKRLRIAETSYTGSSILASLEKSTGSHHPWTILPDPTPTGTEEEDPMSEPDPLSDYHDLVIALNFDGSAPSGYLPDGLDYHTTGEYGLPRRSLDEIVATVVAGPEDIDRYAFNSKYAQYQMPVEGPSYWGKEEMRIRDIRLEKELH